MKRTNKKSTKKASSDKSQTTPKAAKKESPKSDGAQHDRYKSLVDIGIALSNEKELGRILDLILEKALETTEADSASISLTENIKIDSIGTTGQKVFTVLRFHRNANRVTRQRLQDKVIAIDETSIAGYCALTGQSVRVDDCYSLEGAPFSFDPTTDTEMKYKTISMLTIPMKSPTSKVRGVLQILNKIGSGTESAKHKRALVDFDDVVPFTDEDQKLMEVFASQASVAIENAKLTEDIENLFESFIRASVTAIESRDPQTSGHSDRVAVFTVEFARAVHQCTTGPLRSTEFSEQQIREIRYAALLHDFGKIGVRESVLRKEQKLYPHEIETILLRLDSARARQEMMTWKDMAMELVETFDKNHLHGHPGGPPHPRQKLSQVNEKIDQFAHQMQQVRLSILKANQPQVLAQDFDIASLMTWINKASRDLDQTLLTNEEIIKLSMPKGSLSEEERREIESHVSHTYHFLRQIAWTEDLSSVADIAHAHHEKCDGTGYPRGLTAEHIPVQAKIMTISDIYDALTAMDRPYKPALSADRALDILHWEGRQGKLDLDLLKVFVEAEVFRSADGMRLRKAG